MVRGQGLVVLGVAAVLVGGAALLLTNELQKQARQRSPQAPHGQAQQRDKSDEEEELAVREEVRARMEKDLEDMMVAFLKDNKDTSFEEFMLNHFPENVTVHKDGRVECDARVLNDAWQGRFLRLQAAATK